MPANIDVRVSPSLHPENVRKLDGYNDATAPYLAPIESAFSTAYEGIRSVHDARVQAERNPGWNEEQRIVQISRMSEKKLDQISRGFDAARVTLVKQITQIETDFNAPVEARASTFIAAEIRAHAKGIPTGKHDEFVRQAIRDGDVVTMTALLGAPAYLSGMTVEMQKMHQREYREHSSPELAQRLKAMQGAKALIEERAGIVFNELEKAVGASMERTGKLRKNWDDALKAIEA